MISKWLLIGLTAMSLLFISCEKQTHTDSCGKSDFILKNNTSNMVYYSCTTTEEYTQSETFTGSINGNSQILLLKNIYGKIGSRPCPSEVFIDIHIFADENFVNQIYIQNPVADSLWQHEKPAGFDDWEYAKYSLFVE